MRLMYCLLAVLSVSSRDLYGDTLFNARPGIATDPSKPGLVSTRYGLLDPNPTPDEKILPRNYGRGPGLVMLNMRVSKTFTFVPSREGVAVSDPPQPGGGDRRVNAGVFNAAAGPRFFVGFGQPPLHFSPSPWRSVTC